jgi:gluconate:H+ symporter, GntP family
MPNASLLILLLAATVLFVVIATGRHRLHPFLVLLVAAYGVGIGAGLPLSQVGSAVAFGFGSLMNSIGIVILAATVISTSLERSGAAIALADWVLRMAGNKRPALAMNATGYLVSMSIFCESGFAILAPLTRAVSARTGTSITVLTVALATGLYATNSLAPPTPGPLAATLALNANIGLVVLLGMIVAVPVALAGMAWGLAIDQYGRGLTTSLRPEYVQWDDLVASHGPLPSVTASLMPLVAPLALIAAASLAALPAFAAAPPRLLSVVGFLGYPATALLVGAFISLSLTRGGEGQTSTEWISDGLKGGGTMLAITGAGGALGHVLAVARVGEAFGGALAHEHLGLLAPFLIASILKTAQGSTTVAMVTAAAIVAPIVAQLGYASEIGRALLVLSIACGGMAVSHVNDRYFWVVAQGAGLPAATAYRAQTLATLVQAVTGLAIVGVLARLFA